MSTSEKTGIARLLSAIGLWFTGLFNAVKRAWNSTSEDVQLALKKASGIVAIINQNVDKAPDFVWTLVQKKFPDITEEKFKAIMKVIADDLGIAESVTDPDLFVTLQNIINKMAELKGTGSKWAEVSHGLYVAISIFEAPKGTKLAAIVSFAEYVYHKFFKHNR